jgi:aryl-alcohol dehydrogenase-like predicted oxidoreductase
MEANTMEKRQLGKNGDFVSVIGFGAWPIGGAMGTVDEQTAIGTVQAAIDHGVTLIDTAQAYRTSESLIGQALKGGRREQVFLATKVSRSYSPQHIREAIENSLRQLQTDCVDLYQIHSWNAQYPIDESMETMEKLRQEGKTRYIGVSNFNAEQMQRAAQTAPFHSLQPRYNLLGREIEVDILPYCEANGVGILAHSPLAKGLLTGKYAPDHQFPEDDERSHMPRFQGEAFRQNLEKAEKLKAIAQQRNLSLVQLAIGWLLRLPAVTCVLVGAKNPEQVAEHVGGQGWQLSEAELQEIESVLIRDNTVLS